MNRRDIHSFYIGEELNNKGFKLPGNLKHLNESGNGVLAFRIAEILIENGIQLSKKSNILK